MQAHDTRAADEATIKEIEEEKKADEETHSVPDESVKAVSGSVVHVDNIEEKRK